MRCPENAFVYNTTQCACNPGFLYNPVKQSCLLFSERDSVDYRTGVDYSLAVLRSSIFDFNSIKKFTQSQAVFLETTLVLLLSWLFFCLFLRLVGKVQDGSSPWFKMRWCISRLDVCFSTHHWLKDQKPVIKRKTELGGTFSIASWILFTGLLAALLYEIISKRSVEVHSVRATNAPDLDSFQNDFEFNITTISTMTCSNLRGLGTLVIGNPGAIDHRTTPLSMFANFSCLNTTRGPTITLKCHNCHLFRDIACVSWQFVDTPNSPAIAVGFEFNLTAKNPADKKHLSYVGGIKWNVSNDDNRPITFRGQETNILKFNLFPRLYHTMHELKLIQPLFDEFLPGTYFSDVTELQASLQNKTSGLVNTTLYINFLMDYITEVNNQNILGPDLYVSIEIVSMYDSVMSSFVKNAVSFVAELGGLFCFSIGIFYCFLVQCEYRIKKLRHEDSVIRMIRSRHRAQKRWDKLRKYVMYTWGCNSLTENLENDANDVCCISICTKNSHKNRSSVEHNTRTTELAMMSFSKKTRAPTEQGDVQRDRKQPPMGSSPGICSQAGALSTPVNLTLGPPPSLGSKATDEMTLTDLQKSLQNLYDYNAILSEKLVAAQSIIHALSEKSSSSSSVTQT